MVIAINIVFLLLLEYEGFIYRINARLIKLFTTTFLIYFFHWHHKFKVFFMGKILYIPDVLQYSDFGCGDMCAQAVMAYYGTDINEIKLLKKLKTRKTIGTGTEHIIEFFEKKKFKVEARSMYIDDLISFINKEIPVIILAQAWKNSKVRYQRTKAFGHYMIAIGYDDKNIYFEDTAIFGKGYIP
jgi:predicted double-glycine peptidase